MNSNADLFITNFKERHLPSILNSINFFLLPRNVHSYILLPTQYLLHVQFLYLLHYYSYQPFKYALMFNFWRGYLSLLHRSGSVANSFFCSFACSLPSSVFQSWGFCCPLFFFLCCSSIQKNVSRRLVRQDWTFERSLCSRFPARAVFCFSVFLFQCTCLLVDNCRVSMFL